MKESWQISCAALLIIEVNYSRGEEEAGGGLEEAREGAAEALENSFNVALHIGFVVLKTSQEINSSTLTPPQRICSFPHLAFGEKRASFGDKSDSASDICDLEGRSGYRRLALLLNT